MPESRHRGPRFVPATPVRFEPGRCALMPDILGRVLWIARSAVQVTQQEVAEHLFLPTSTVSKLELGTITQAVHHLDALAGAYSHFARQLWGDDAEAWEGWELHFVATAVAEALGEQGWAVVWAAPDDFERDEREVFVKGRRLVAQVKACWPREMRGKVGW